MITGNTSQVIEGEKMDIMTDLQFKKILEMVLMILDGCKNLDEAKNKIKELADKETTDSNKKDN